jgi:molybdate transport system substrate-binding protein
MRRAMAVVALVAACGGGSEREATLTVSVAASLKDVVGALADDFRALHPRVQIAINSGSSGMLAQQIEQGAPVDVFVSAGRLEIDRLVQKGLVAGTPATLARNRLVVVVPRGSTWQGKPPRDVLTSADVHRVASGDPNTVPFGRYTKEALTKAALWDAVRPKMIFAMDVRQALTYAEQRDVDAAIVYATDGVSADGLVVLGELPGGQTVRIENVAARLARSQVGAAERFFKYLTSDTAAAEFVRRGFLPSAP